MFKIMLRIFKKIKPIDITLIQTDWNNDDYPYSYKWTAYFYGERIGCVKYSNLNKTWQIYLGTYSKPEYLLKTFCISGGNLIIDEVTFDEIRYLRKIKRIYSRKLNRIGYK